MAVRGCPRASGGCGEGRGFVVGGDGSGCYLAECRHPSNAMPPVACFAIDAAVSCQLMAGFAATSHSDKCLALRKRDLPVDLIQRRIWVLQPADRTWYEA